MGFISYAQNFEDVMLRRAFRDVAQGFYVDVGAWHPTQDSVTRAFYDAGWHGINVEPSPIFARLDAARPRDVSLNVALGERPGRLRLRVHRVGDAILGSSTLLTGPLPQVPGPIAVHEEEAEVEVLTLAQVLDAHAAGQHIHFLKIDAEGAEGAILRGADWQRHRPEVLVIEATRPQSQERTDAEWEPLLIQAGYRPVWFDGLNAWFLREESTARAEAFRLPPNVFDDFRLYDPEAERRLTAAEAWGQSLEQSLRQTTQHSQALEQALQQTTEHSQALEQALARARDELRRAIAGRAAEAARAAAFEQEITELQEALARNAERLTDTAAALAARAESQDAVDAERRALAAERWRLVHRLEMPSGPRVLQLTLPAARILRRIFWTGRIPTPSPPPEIAALVGASPEGMAEGRLPMSLRAGTPAVTPDPPPPDPQQTHGPAAGAESDPRLARSVEAALLTLALRGGDGAANKA